MKEETKNALSRGLGMNYDEFVKDPEKNRKEIEKKSGLDPSNPNHYDKTCRINGTHIGFTNSKKNHDKSK